MTDGRAAQDLPLPPPPLIGPEIADNRHRLRRMEPTWSDKDTEGSRRQICASSKGFYAEYRAVYADRVVLLETHSKTCP